jgi:DNA polymerase V
MMRILRRFSPKVEVYSIDEAFLDCSDVPPEQLSYLGQEIQHTLKQGLGLPVSIGFGRTKTLAKAANYFAKQSQSLKGVYVYLNDATSPAPLMLLPIEKVWGIGRSYAHFLKKCSIDTAYKFKHLSEAFVRKHMSVIGARTLRELNGHSCIPLELTPPVKQTLTVSRTLKKATLSYEDVRQAVATHTVRACEKLRSHHLLASGVTAFITSTHHPRGAYYAESAALSLPEATSLTQPILHAALAIVEEIFKAGIYYKKVGVTLIDLVPETQIQKDLFFPGYPHSPALIRAMDQLNQTHGRHTVIFGATGLQRRWQQVPMVRSARYSTRATELLCIC